MEQALEQEGESVVRSVAVAEERDLSKWGRVIGVTATIGLAAALGEGAGVVVARLVAGAPVEGLPQIFQRLPSDPIVTTATGLVGLSLGMAGGIFLARRVFPR